MLPKELEGGSQRWLCTQILRQGPEPFIYPFNKYLARQRQGVNRLGGKEGKYRRYAECSRRLQLGGSKEPTLTFTAQLALQSGVSVSRRQLTASP